MSNPRTPRARAWPSSSAASLAIALALPPLALAQDPAPEPAAAESHQAPADDTPAPSLHDLRARLATRFEGALSDSSNGQDFVQTQGYMKLLASVARFTPEDAAARATRHLDWHAGMQAPDEWRGEWVTFRGVLARLAAEKLVAPVEGREHVWRATVINDSEELRQKEPPEGAVFVDFLDKPEGEFEERRDPVDVVGVFYRTVAFENFEGKPRQAVYVIGRTLEHVDRDVARRTPIPWWGLLIIGAGAAIGALHLVNILRSRSRRRGGREVDGTDFHQMFQARTKGLDPKSRPGSPH